MTTVQTTSPFKLLDAYTADDLAIFFGRDAEIEQLYKLIHQSDLLLVYGRSGTGKTSLVQCGLAGRFKATDRFEILVRRQENLNAALARELRRVAAADDGTPLPDETSVPDAVYSIYMDRLRPIHLIFDQFEELLLLGTKEEQEQFFATLVALLKRKLRCKVILVMREEFLAMLDPFETTLPGLFANRCRIERMTRKNLEDVIIRTAKAIPVVLAEGHETAAQILENLGTGPQLSYLQVYLDRLYRRATEAGPDRAPASPVVFSADLVRDTGALDDVLASFLDEQVKAVQAGVAATPGMPPDAAQRVLEEFATIEGTKQPMAPDELKERLSTLSPIVDRCLQAFVSRRVLRPVDNFYELAHDSLARRIADTRGAERKMQLKAVRLIQDHLIDFDAAHPRFLSDDDLDFVKPFEAKLELTAEERAFYRTSVAARRKKQRSRMRRQLLLAAVIVISLSAALIWALLREAEIEGILTDTRAAIGDLFRIEGSLEPVAGAETVRLELRARTRWLVDRLGLAEVGSEGDPNLLFWEMLRDGDRRVNNLEGLEARTSYEMARALAEEVGEDTGEAVWLRNLAVAELALGGLFVDPEFAHLWDEQTDRLALAEEAYVIAGEIVTSLAEENGVDAQSQGDRFDVAIGFGRLALQRHDLATALSRYQEALRIAGEIAGQEESTVEELGASIPTAMRKVLAHRLMAEAQEATDVPAARDNFHQAIGIGSKVFELVSDQAVAKELFALYTQLGTLEREAGDFETARTAYSTAEYVNEFLAADAQRSTAMIHEGRGGISLAERDWASARRHYQAQLELVERRARVFPEDVDTKRILVVVYSNLGYVEASLPKPNVAAARAMYLKAEAVAKELESAGHGRADLEKVTVLLEELGQ